MAETRVLELDGYEQAGGGAVGDSLGAGAAPRRRRRWWLRILVTLVVIALLAVGAEFALRAIIPSVIASNVREGLGLGKDHPVEVQQGGSALMHALTGHVGEVQLTVPDVEVFDGIVTTLHASADSMPFDPTAGDILGGTASATIPSSSMDAVVKLATDGLVDTGEVRAGEILVGRTIELFGLQVPLSATLAVSVENGDLLIEPTSVRAVGFDLQAEQLRSLLGESAAGVLDAHAVCVRDRMPAGIRLTGIELRSGLLGGSATVTVDLAPDLLSNPRQQQLGTC